MTTYLATAQKIRRILQDYPDRTYLSANITDTTTKTFTVNDISKFSKGSVWEHADYAEVSAELREVETVDPSGGTVTASRGYADSTAATHLSASYMVKDPKYRYDLILQAIDTVLDRDLWDRGIFDIIEHIVTSSATSSAYNAPTTSCMEWLWVYQRIISTDPPRSVIDFTRLPRNVDTTLWANGKVFEINGNWGTPGTANYYVNCKHRLAIGTLSTQQERIVQWLACAYLLEWTEPKRLSGPTNQNDRTIKPGQGIGDAQYYRALAERAMGAERSLLKSENPAFRTFRKQR